jgi:hypothetical protein
MLKTVFFKTTISSELTVSRRHGHDFSGKRIPFAWTVSLTGDQSAVHVNSRTAS